RGRQEVNRAIQHVRTNTVAYLSLFVALGGTSYAAWRIPLGSVSGRQIRNHVIDPVRLNPTFITQSILASAAVNGRGTITAYTPRAKILKSVGRDQVISATAFARHCEPPVTVNNPTGPGGPSWPAFVDASMLPEQRDRLGALVSTYAMP